ncbi:MAG: DUF4868 domain-containing protein [Bacteroidetes bacterium]|nr:DUF4868 domain-containing protein [Bacteroidota bacterium]
MLQPILNTFNSINNDNALLYFITRILKEDAKKRSKIIHKYNFKIYQVDVDNEIREHLYNLTKETLRHLIEKNFTITEYDIISDDTQNLFTYSINNKTMAFADIVNIQLKKQPIKIQSFQDITDKEKLWAYCVGFYDNDNNWIYTFRKISLSKVAIDEKHGNKKGFFKKMIQTRFNSNSKKLELIEGDTVNLDKQVDCLFYDNLFYVIKKAQFEQIVGLEEEYKQQAIQINSDLKQTKMIDGLDFIDQQIENNPAIHKKLVRLAKIGNYKNLNKEEIIKMQNIWRLIKWEM